MAQAPVKMTAPVAPNDLDNALAHLRNGGTLAVTTYTHQIVLTGKTLTKFENAGSWLLKTEGNGYRLKTGGTSIYLFPGQLHYAETYK